MRDSKAHLNIKQGNKHQSNDIVRSYEGDAGVTGEAMMDRLLQTGKLLTKVFNLSVPSVSMIF